MKTKLLDTITSPFPKITSQTTLDNVNNQIRNDHLYKITVSNFICSKLDTNIGAKTSLKTVFNLLFERDFLLTCTWVKVGDSDRPFLKETEIIKLTIGKYFFFTLLTEKKSLTGLFPLLVYLAHFNFAFPLIFSERATSIFSNVTSSYINDILVTYLQSIKRNAKTAGKKKPVQLNETH